MAFRESQSGAKGSFKVSISPKESRYEVRDLPAGEYELQIYKIEQPNEETGYPESTLIRRIDCRVESGKRLKLDINAVQAR